MSVTSYTQGHAAATLSSHHTRSAEEQADYLLPYINHDDYILEVGCGTDIITCSLAKYVLQGRVVGVDDSPGVLEQAQRAVQVREVDNVTFEIGSAFELPFDDETFDIVHSHARLVHPPKAVNALKEMVRDCKIGGYIAAREADRREL